MVFLYEGGEGKRMLDSFLDMLAMILTTVVVLLVGWMIFQAFGFEAEQRWQFLLFMICFIALDALFGSLGDRIGLWMFERGWIESFWQITLCHAMLDFLSELGILLTLRHLPGIHIRPLGAYQLAFFWGLADVAVSCWDEWKNSEDE